MKRVCRVLCWVVCAVLCVSIAFVSWMVFSFRPICREDLSPAAPAAVTARAEGGTRLKLLTWNIQMLPSLFGGRIEKLDKMQHLRAGWIVEYLKQQDYDVVCLQEAFDPRCVKILVDGLKDTYPHIVVPRYGGHFWQQSSGVMFLARVPIRHVAHVVYPTGERIERFAAKGATLIEGSKDGVVFQIAGTHFQTGKERFKRQDAQTAARDLLQPNRRDRVPQFFVGDFNIRKDTPEYEVLMRETGMVEFPIDDPRPYTSDATNSWKRGTQKQSQIDHVLLDARGTKTTVTRQQIQRARREHRGDTIDLADHYGVIAEVTVEN